MWYLQRSPSANPLGSSVPSAERPCQQQWSSRWWQPAFPNRVPLGIFNHHPTSSIRVPSRSAIASRRRQTPPCVCVSPNNCHPDLLSIMLALFPPPTLYTFPSSGNGWIQLSAVFFTFKGQWWITIGRHSRTAKQASLSGIVRCLVSRFFFPRPALVSRKS